MCGAGGAGAGWSIVYCGCTLIRGRDDDIGEYHVRVDQRPVLGVRKGFQTKLLSFDFQQAHALGVTHALAL